MVHPVGTRLLLSYISNVSILYEATIIEWAKSGYRVKYRLSSGEVRWEDCRDYSPVVIEILNFPE